MDSELVLQINREVEQARQEHGKEWGMSYLNNFHGDLPGGYRRLGYDPAAIYAGDTSASEKRRNQSHGEYWATIDQVIEEVGICPTRIIEARDRWRKHNDWGMFDLILPAYIKMRELGYMRYPDLVG
ncbi:hypothetical protein ACFL3V_00400 [Nanoarchaeota archaeon]